MKLLDEDNPWAYESGQNFPEPSKPRNRVKARDYGVIWNRRTRCAELVIAGSDRTYYMPLGPNELEDFASCLFRLQKRYLKRDWPQLRWS